MVLYRTSIMTKGDTSTAAYVDGLTIHVWPQYLRDKFFMEHEKVHIWQALRLFYFLHWLIFFRSERYRLFCEIEAYRISLKYGKSCINSVAKSIRDTYDFEGLTVANIKKRLREGISWYTKVGLWLLK